MSRFRLILGLAGVLIPIFGFTMLQKAPEPAYVTAGVERGALATILTATGTLKAVGTVKVGSQLSGQIAELLADFNDKVVLGQPLARLDPSIFAAKVRELEAALDSMRAKLTVAQMAPEKAQADLASAHAAYAMAMAKSASARSKADETKRNYERKRLLTTSATLAQAAIDQASAEYQSAAALLQAAEAECAMKHGEVLAAEAALRMAQAEQQHAVGAVKQQTAALEQALVDLERTVIRAPVDGEVIGRDIDRGQTVAASLEAPTLFTIAQDLSQMELHAKIDEADIGRVQPGQRASFTVDAFPNRRFAGHIAQIRKAPETIQNVVTYTVVLAAENRDMALLPGMTATVQVVIEHLDDVLKIPNAALRFRPPDHAAAASDRTGSKIGDYTRRGRAGTVWTLDAAGRPSPVGVRLGRTDAAATELIDGPLHPGQSVIVGTAFADPGILLFGFRLRALTWPGR